MSFALRVDWSHVEGSDGCYGRTQRHHVVMGTKKHTDIGKQTALGEDRVFLH